MPKKIKFVIIKFFQLIDQYMIYVRAKCAIWGTESKSPGIIGDGGNASLKFNLDAGWPSCIIAQLKQSTVIYLLKQLTHFDRL